MSEINVVILAAGEGKRMKDNIPKPLHKVTGLPMIERVCRAVKEINPKNIIAVESPFEDFSSFVDQTVIQENYSGSADALKCALPKITSEKVLVINADMPLITGKTLEKFVKNGGGSDSSVLVSKVKNPTDYGRVLTVGKSQVVEQIIEEKDATEEQKKINLINTGIYLFKLDYIKRAIRQVENNNKQREYYLTDVLTGAKIFILKNWQESLGVNNLRELAEVSVISRKKINKEMMDNGVILIDPKNTYIDDHVVIGSGTVIKPGTIIEHDSVIGPDNEIGPFAHLRPKTITGTDVHIGNFVETKNSKIGNHTHVEHLTYVGDALIGEGTNIGAGSVFVNYDGKNKHITKVGNRAFIGSGTKLIAPVQIADEAITAAGSTITNNISFHDMGIARQRQTNKKDFWKRMNHENFALNYKKQGLNISSKQKPNK